MSVRPFKDAYPILVLGNQLVEVCASSVRKACQGAYPSLCVCDNHLLQVCAQKSVRKACKGAYPSLCVYDIHLLQMCAQKSVRKACQSAYPSLCV